MTTTSRKASRSVSGMVPAIALVTLVTLGGCSGADEPQLSPEKTLAAAKKNLDATSGVRIALSAGRLPPDVNGLLTADGVGTHDPAFDGRITVWAGGVTADATVVAVTGKVYAKLPFTSRFVPIDPGEYGAPDPADLMNTDGGLSSLLTAATDIEQGDEVRAGKTVLSSYSATVPGKAVAAVIPSAARAESFKASFTVSDANRLAKAVLEGPFYPRAEDVTYTITFEDYGSEKDITAPTTAP